MNGLVNPPLAKDLESRNSETKVCMNLHGAVLKISF